MKDNDWLKKHYGLTDEDIQEFNEEDGNVASLGPNPKTANGLVDEPVDELDPEQDMQADDQVDAQLDNLLGQIGALGDHADEVEALAQALADAQGQDDDLNQDLEDLGQTDNLLRDPNELEEPHKDEDAMAPGTEPNPEEERELAHPEDLKKDEELNPDFLILPDMRDEKVLPNGAEGADIPPGDTKGPADKGLQQPAEGQETLKKAEPQPLVGKGEETLGEAEDDLDKDLGNLDLRDKEEKEDDECSEEADPENDSKDENPAETAKSGQINGGKGQEPLKKAEPQNMPDEENDLDPKHEEEADPVQPPSQPSDDDDWKEMLKSMPDEGSVKAESKKKDLITEIEDSLLANDIKDDKEDDDNPNCEDAPADATIAGMHDQTVGDMTEEDELELSHQVPSPDDLEDIEDLKKDHTANEESDTDHLILPDMKDEKEFPWGNEPKDKQEEDLEPSWAKDRPEESNPGDDLAKDKEEDEDTCSGEGSFAQDLKDWHNTSEEDIELHPGQDKEEVEDCEDIVNPDEDKEIKGLKSKEPSEEPKEDKAKEQFKNTQSESKFKAFLK